MTDGSGKVLGIKLHDSELAQMFVNYARFVESRASMHNASTGSLGEEVNSGMLIDVIVAEIQRICDMVVVRRLDLSKEVVRDFRVLMAAWADEVLIRLGLVDNGGVETKLCNTANAGETFFLLVERIIDRRNGNDISLGAVCFLMLLMGFQGHYVGNPELIRLQHYIGALRAIAASEKVFSPLVTINAIDVATTISGSSIVSWVPSVKFSVSLFVALLLIAMGGLSGHWLGSSASLEQSLRRATEEFGVNFDSSRGRR